MTTLFIVLFVKVLDKIVTKIKFLASRNQVVPKEGPEPGIVLELVPGLDEQHVR
jgi:hypothetical protein